MITNYTELTQAVADWLGRSDLDAHIPTFIANAEARLNKRVRHRDMETEQILPPGADGEYDLPVDYLEWRLLTLDTAPQARPEFVEPDSREFLYRFRPYSVPQYFTIVGTKLRVQPATDATGRFYYYAKIPALTAGNPSNWLLARSPEAYLYAALLEGDAFLHDDGAMQRHSALLGAALQELMSDGRAARLGREPAPPAELSAKVEDSMQ